MWTTEWPTKEGLYWFYGWQDKYCLAREGPRLSVFRVIEAGPSDKRWQAYVCDGCPVWKNEGGKGYFKPIDLPDLPDLALLKEE